MCLSKITAKYKYSTPIKEMIGYQVVMKTDIEGENVSGIRHDGAIKKIGTKTKSEMILAYCEKGDSNGLPDTYFTGFHCFENEQDAYVFMIDYFWNWKDGDRCIIKVKGENIRIKGVQDDKEIFVSEYITVLNEEKELGICTSVCTPFLSDSTSAAITTKMIANWEITT